MTRTLIALMLPVLLWSQHPARAQGITFVSGSWTEVLAQAKAARKLIFVDAYAEWCGPCKAMARNTFPDPAVGQFFNKHFISYKFDMEKGEGPAFAARYGITAYPTLLFINYDGKVVSTVLGYQTPAQLLKAGEAAASPDKTQDRATQEGAEGSSTPQNLLDHAMRLYQQKKDWTEGANQYFRTQADKDLISTANWQAIRLLTTDISSREFQYLVTRQKTFAKAFGTQPVTDKIKAVLRHAVLEAALGRQPDRYSQALALADQLDDNGQTASRLRMTYAEASGDWLDYTSKALHHFKTYTVTDARELDLAARNFLLHTDDTGHLEAALNWSRQSAALEQASWNHETQARLLIRLGRQREALPAANIALRLAEAAGEETDELLALVRELQ
ncbi:MAG: thioredoxin family protein [Bacteroidia bacterium]|nr:thioredoxin family protein [Bacteroidia bacterium]